MRQHPGIARLPAAIAVTAMVACGPAPGAVTQTANEADLLILGGTLITMDEDRRLIDDAGIAVRDTAIVAMGSRAEIEASWSAAETIRARPHDIVMPGLINGHGHAPMVLLRGIADDLALMEWLEDYIFPAEARTVDAEFVRAGTGLAAMEMIRSGTTTYVDMYYFEDDAAEVLDEIGMRAVLGESLIDFPVPGSPTPADSLAYSRAFMERWKEHPRITAGIAPHAPYTVSPENLIAAAELAREFEAPILIHLAETMDEVDQVIERFGKTPVQHLADIGFLGPDVLGAHGIWLDDADIELLASHDVGLVHNPESNMKLASGVMRLPDLLAAGIAVGLGTDGAASNNDLDMFGALLTAPLQQKNVRTDPTVAPAPAILEMATVGGARALGMEESIGSLEIGKQADIIIVDGDAPNLVPRYDPYSLVVYAARGGNVRTTIVAGRTLFADGEFRTLDVESTLAEARAQAVRIRAALRP